MNEFPLLHNIPPLPAFDGKTYLADFDSERLTGQWRRVWDVMKDGIARTLSELQSEVFKRYEVHDSQTGLSARIRDLRKPRFGGHTVIAERRGDKTRGIWQYTLIPR